LKDIAVELSKQGQVEESLAIARGISVDGQKSSALNAIAVELSKQGHLAMAEAVGLEVPQLAKRHSCWKAIAEETTMEMGCQKSLLEINHLKSDEAHLFYLKGWVENLSICETGNSCLFQALPLLAKDSQSIENLLTGFALHEVFFRNASKEKINRLNRSLNIQWAIDIAAQFPKPEAASRLSTNLEYWLHEVEDEDDRDQIELWARQVAKGKITEAEFLQQVTALQ
jgi:hypothetical protein